jgi:glycine/D-amino acid oxidase-like deaminating enzyme
MAGGSHVGASVVTGATLTLGVGQPIWLDHAGRLKRRYPTLSGSHTTSVAIVGGGMTGALVSHAFASAGISTVLLEGALVGRGSTGAIRTRGSARFDPYRACVGIVRAAVAAGACVFERSRVHRISTTGDRVRVHTRNGVISADRVVIATGYATPQFRPLTGRFRMYRTYVLATEPLSTAQRRHLDLADVLVWDTERPYHYARWAPGHRLLLGGSDRLVRPRSRRATVFAAATRELRAHFEKSFPVLAQLETPLAWEGLFAITPDSLPYIGPHRRYPRHWFALGYGGNGMTFGALAARLLLERRRRTTSDDHALFEFGRMRQRTAP